MSRLSRTIRPVASSADLCWHIHREYNDPADALSKKTDAEVVSFYCDNIAAEARSATALCLTFDGSYNGREGGTAAWILWGKDRTNCTPLPWQGPPVGWTRLADGAFPFKCTSAIHSEIMAITAGVQFLAWLLQAAGNDPRTCQAELFCGPDLARII